MKLKPLKPKKAAKQKVLEDVLNGVETAIIVMKLTGQSKERWLATMSKAWDETEISSEVTSHH